MSETAKKFDFKSCLCSDSLFRKFFLVTLSFEMIALLDVVSLAFKCILICGGFFILVHNFFIQKRAFAVKYKSLIWLFLGAMFVTSCVHMSIWFVPNLVLIIFTAMCFFMFYGMYTNDAHETIEKEMVFIFKFFAFFGAICAALSLLILFIKHEITIGPYHLGIYQNRLIGIYTNSNILAFSMIESIIACDILSSDYIKNKFKSVKINSRLLAVCASISCVCLFLSDSNASFLFLIVYVTIRVFCNMFFQNKSFKISKLFKSIIIIFSFCVVVMSISFYLRDVCQNFISKAMSEPYVSQEAQQDEQISETPDSGLTLIVPAITDNSDIDGETEQTEIHIGREHYEVSSGRITLFKQGLEIFKHNPIIGIGRANLTLYSKKYLKNGLIHPDLHNGYLTILVSYGIVGFCIFAVFSFVVALDVCKHMFVCTSKNYFKVFSKLFSVLVAYCGYCLFEKAILFDMTFMVGFFWMILGYAVSYVQNNIKVLQYTQNKKPIIK